jgi:hypothetical protein
VEGYGVEVEIKRVSPTEAKGSHGIEPKIEELGVAGGIDPAAVLGQESALGCTVEPGKESEPLIEDIAHHMRVASIAKEFESQKRAHRMTGRDHLRARESGFLHQLIEGDSSQIRQEEKKAPEPSSEPAGREVQLAHIGSGRELRPRTWWSFFVLPAGESCESLLFNPTTTFIFESTASSCVRDMTHGFASRCPQPNPGPPLSRSFSTEEGPL